MLQKLWNFLPLETLHGYEHPELVDVVFRKTVAYVPTLAWPEMIGVATVLDFGGGCGQHYKRANSSTVKWAVVETPAMVSRAQQLETDNLKFFDDIERAARWLGNIDVMHSDGAVQYTSSPIETIRRLCDIGATTLLWHRIPFGNGAEMQVSRLMDNGPGRMAAPLKKVSYQRILVSKAAFLDAHLGYDLRSEGADWFHFTRLA